MAKNERLQRNGEVFLVPIDSIVVDEEKNNKRIDYGDIEALANSILHSGLKTPVSLKKFRGEDKYELTHGHRRLRAIKHLASKGIDFPRVRAFLNPSNYNEDDVLVDMIVMNDGKPLTNYEQGLVFVQLTHRGFKEKEISERVGRSISYIHNCIEMAELPKNIQNKIADGSISGLTAVEIFKNSEDENEASKFVEESIEKAKEENGGKNKKATKRHASNVSKSPMKTLESLKSLLEEKEIENEKTELLKKVVSRLKAKETPEDFIKLFE